MAACEGHIAILDYLVRDTYFDFSVVDRWGNRPFDELKDIQVRARLEKEYQTKIEQEREKIERIKMEQKLAFECQTMT